jgi:hypothetical protein
MLRAAGAEPTGWSLWSDNYTTTYRLPAGWRLERLDPDGSFHSISRQQLRHWVVLIDPFDYPRAYVRLKVDTSGAVGTADLAPFHRLNSVKRLVASRVGRRNPLLATMLLINLAFKLNRR